MRNIFITGEKRIGKTTILRKLLEKFNQNYDLKLGGYTCTRTIIEEKNKSSREFFLKSISDSNIYKILEKRNDGIQKISKVYLENFDIYSETLKKDLEDCDVLILDEIGYAEADSLKYVHVLNEVLDSEKVVIGILKKYDCNLINNIRNREDVILFDIDIENRDYICDKIYDNLTNLIDSWIEDNNLSR